MEIQIIINYNCFMECLKTCTLYQLLGRTAIGYFKMFNSNRVSNVLQNIHLKLK